MHRPQEVVMNKPMEDLGHTLAKMTRPMALCQSLDEDRVRCLACAHRCLIPPGKTGICKVRFNEGGVLKGPWGYVAGLANEPIEKKPFFHVMPGSHTLSFGMLGCDFHCEFCQNWLTTQTLRDPESIAPYRPILPDELIRLAHTQGAASIMSTYNEPNITTEWALDIFRKAKQSGLFTGFVSNGYNSDEAITALTPWLDAYKVDLKTFEDKKYRQLGATLNGVLDGLSRVWAHGLWLEVVTLVVPGFNDDPGEIKAMAQFIAKLSPDIPWHLTAFHPEYRMQDRGPTPPSTLLNAYDIAKKEGLHYVYTGNAPGRLGHTESTYCPQCETLLVERSGFQVRANHLQEGACPKCKTAIPGRWKPQNARPTQKDAA